MYNVRIMKTRVQMRTGFKHYDPVRLRNKFILVYLFIYFVFLSTIGVVLVMYYPAKSLKYFTYLY